eukprot:gb/GECG01012291.1/.p1 GENE.gb/GECG01012291.1/~~gb/GECG01012291.1/.p1  ORF type:complete len:133 (+),score=8.53 gb/GECG01012291.1/:1-399(+)
MDESGRNVLTTTGASGNLTDIRGQLYHHDWVQQWESGVWEVTWTVWFSPYPLSSFNTVYCHVTLADGHCDRWPCNKCCPSTVVMNAGGLSVTYMCVYWLIDDNQIRWKYRMMEGKKMVETMIMGAKNTNIPS